MRRHLLRCTSPVLADIVAKVFSGRRTKILRTADALYEPRREGTISFHPKSITDLRSGVEKRRSSREVQRSTFARFLGLFDFRLLQQYRRKAVVRITARTCRGYAPTTGPLCCRRTSGPSQMAQRWAGFTDRFDKSSRFRIRSIATIGSETRNCDCAGRLRSGTTSPCSRQSASTIGLRAVNLVYPVTANRWLPPALRKGLRWSGQRRSKPQGQGAQAEERLPEKGRHLFAS